MWPCHIVELHNHLPYLLISPPREGLTYFGSNFIAKVQLGHSTSVVFIYFWYLVQLLLRYMSLETTRHI